MDGEDIFNACGMIFIFLFFVTLVGGVCFNVYDGAYNSPIARQKATDYCMMQGFDTYESFSRTGLLIKSQEPLAIECKYVDRDYFVQESKSDDVIKTVRIKGGN